MKTAIILSFILTFSLTASAASCLIENDIEDEIVCEFEGERSGLEYSATASCHVYIMEKNSEKDGDYVSSQAFGKGSKTIKSKNPWKVMMAEVKAKEGAEAAAREDLHQQLAAKKTCSK